jgi:uncharacterized membrane protein
MTSDHGFRRLVGFGDAVVAIAITLLILPLVDSASSIGTTGLDEFYHHNSAKLFAFVLSFVVIGAFWWGQHQLFERVQAYNGVLMGGMFVWLFSIVFLPFPTELIGSVTDGIAAAHALYIGTMVVTALGALVQAGAVVRWPELQVDAASDPVRLDPALILAGLMTLALVLTLAVPSVGLWPLLGLVLSRPLERLADLRRRRKARPAA